jgi:hypothetical protein
MTTREFPIQTERGAAPHPLLIPWSVAEKAYSVYAARYGRSQSLERLAERGGFGPSEMDEFLPGWRDEVSEITRLRKELADARTPPRQTLTAQRWAYDEMTCTIFDAYGKVVASQVNERDGRLIVAAVAAGGAAGATTAAQEKHGSSL